MARVLVVALTAVVAAGCGSSESSVRLAVSINSGFGHNSGHQNYTLRCNPTGGNMPYRDQLCRMISLHSVAMLDPPRAKSVCLGGPGVPPTVTVSGFARGRHVSLERRVNCDWPGGVGPFAYWSASADPHNLAVAAVRLHCDEDPALQRRPIAWARVRACLDALPPHWRRS
jgi:hypothetical protein